MSIASEIDRLTTAKNSIAASLQTMGVEPPEGTTLDQYAAQLAAIAASAPWLPLAGGTMTGDIQMGGRRVTGVGEPQEDTDAARKGDLAGKLDAPDGGTAGQVLTKTETGTEWRAPASGLPDGGTEGQMLYKGADGAEWGDKPVLYVTATATGNPNVYSSDKSKEEVLAAYEAGSAVFMVIENSGGSRIFKLASITSSTIAFSDTLSDTTRLILAANNTAILQITTPSASGVTFTPTDTITATNVQGAIEELDGKKLDAPTGGTEGQVLTKTANGTKWDDMPSGGGGLGSLRVKSVAGALNSAGELDLEMGTVNQPIAMTEDEFKSKFVAYFVLRAWTNNVSFISAETPYGDRDHAAIFTSSYSLNILNNVDFDLFRFDSGHIYLSIAPNDPEPTAMNVNLIVLFNE